MVTWPRPSSSLPFPVWLSRSRRESLAAVPWPGPPVSPRPLGVRVAALVVWAGFVAAVVVGTLSPTHAAPPVAVRSEASAVACARPTCGAQPLASAEIGLLAAVSFLAVLTVGGIAVVADHGERGLG